MKGFLIGRLSVARANYCVLPFLSSKGHTIAREQNKKIDGIRVLLSQALLVC